MKFFKVLLTDLAGIGLIILSVLTGWIPGPGGIPLLLAGLGLLAINHHWARRLLVSVKNGGLKLAEKFFRDHPVLMIIYDAVALALLATAVVVLVEVQGNVRAAALLLFSIGLALFLGNRRRLQRINNHFRRQKPRQP